MNLYTRAIKAIQTKRLVAQIKAEYPNLKSLPANQVIELYIESELSVDRLSDTRRIPPALYLRALEHVSPLPKGYYVRIFRNTEALAKELGTVNERLEHDNLAYKQIAARAITIGETALNRLEDAGLE